HATEYRFDNVQKLSTSRQWSCLDDWVAEACSLFVSCFDFAKELFRYVPGGRIPGQIDNAAITILRAQQIHHLDHLVRVLLFRIKMRHLLSRKLQRPCND